MKSMDKNPVCPNLAKKSLKGPKNGVFGVLTKIKANVLFIVKSEKSHGPLSFCENHMSGKRGQVWAGGRGRCGIRVQNKRYTAYL